MFAHRPKQKSPTRIIDDQVYLRVLITTHRIASGENFLEIVKRYSQDSLQPGDIVVVSSGAVRAASGADVDLGALVSAMSRILGVQSCVARADSRGHVEILAHTPAVDKLLMKQVLLDNPLGEEGSFTPLCLVRKTDHEEGKEQA
ncbi:MAG: hypothetical protein KGZ50_12175 [Peptococcaceae bacterium]|nr:hypothetical protein [Peptococcaceae bacterium]